MTTPILKAAAKGPWPQLITSCSVTDVFVGHSPHHLPAQQLVLHGSGHFPRQEAAQGLLSSGSSIIWSGKGTGFILSHYCRKIAISQLGHAAAYLYLCLYQPHLIASGESPPSLPRCRYRSQLLKVPEHPMPIAGGSPSTCQWDLGTETPVKAC